MGENAPDIIGPSNLTWWLNGKSSYQKLRIPVPEPTLPLWMLASRLNAKDDFRKLSGKTNLSKIKHWNLICHYFIML